MKREKIKNITYISLSVAILTVISQISFYVGPVPITLQVLAVSLIGYFLGAKRGIISILAYILLGLVGVPVFSGFMGGIYVLFGYTGGFILGFLPLAFMCGMGKKKITCLALGQVGQKKTLVINCTCKCSIYRTMKVNFNFKFN